MLVAMRRNGEAVSLLNSDSREAWERQRSEETFYCPVCKEKVHLKLGTIKQWHFAHESMKSCVGSSEPESPLHLNGKRQLYSWLARQQVQVALEPYIPSIQQRPDILFKAHEQVYALEFQCSPITVERLLARTQGYHSKNILPLWIIGKPHMQGKQTLQNLKAYEWCMLQEYQNSPQLFLTYYFPSKQTFLFLENILPLSTKKVLVTPQKVPLKSVIFQDLFFRHRIEDIKLANEQWITTRKYWRYANSPYPSNSERKFYQFCYENYLYPSLFPIAAGWPTAYFQWIKTPPHIWQTWFLIKIIEKDNQTFSFQTLYRAFKNEVKQGTFSLRNFQQLNGHYSFALMRYLHFLVDSHILKKHGKTHFQTINPIVIPENIEKAHAMDEQFFEMLMHRVQYFRTIFT